MKVSKYSKAKGIAMIVITAMLLIGTILYCSLELSMNPLPTIVVTLVVLCFVLIVTPDKWVREYVKEK